MSYEMENRPPFLSALCILTFVGSTIGFVAYFFAAILFEQTAELIIKFSSWHSVEVISPIYFIFLCLLYGISFSGAVLIWKFHQIGIFLYAASQVIILFLPVVWISWQAFSVTNLIFTAVFIGAYFWNRKHLK